MPARRDFLNHSAKVSGLLIAAGLWPRAALAAWPAGAFEAKSLAEVVKALGAAAPVPSRDVTLTGPDIAENGAVVPLGLSTTLPARRLALLVEKNPNALSAVFELSDGVEADFLTRVKMSQSSNVYAVALLADGRALYAQKEVKVTLGGCGE